MVGPVLKWLRDEDGQVLVEYLLAVSVVVVAIAGAARVLRGSLFRIWKVWTREISSACPDCEPTQPNLTN